MTPQLAGIIVPGVDFGQLEAQNISFFTDFASDLWEKRGFSGKVCSLEVVTNFEKLQFTFPLLVGPGRPSRDTGY
jgi:hypothetical protein